MIKKLTVAFSVIICSFFLFSTFVHASPITDVLGDDVIESMEKASFKDAGVSITDIMENVLSGEDTGFFEYITDSVSDVLFREIKDCIKLIKPMLMAVFFSALIKTINSSFNSKAVTELSFYVCYIVMIFVITEIFYLTSEMVRESLAELGNMVVASMPVFYTLMVASGGYSSALVTGPFVAGVAGTMAGFSKTVIVPAISLGMTLEIVNNITEREKIGKLSELINKCVKWMLKGICGGFIAFLSLQKIGSSAADMASGKTVKALMGAVPVVGDTLSGAIETAVAMTGAVKSSYLVAIIIVIGIICLVPIVKVFVVMMTLKIVAAVTEPLGEKRFIKCISAAGDHIGLLLSTLFTAMIMFMFAAILLIGVI